MFKNFMRNWPHGLAVISATLWVGGMWAIGYLAVPVLFHALPDNRMLAGALAGGVFAAMAYAGMACAAYLTGYILWRAGSKAFGLGIFRVLMVMLLLTLLGKFGLQPVMDGLKAQALPLDVMHSELADRFRMLHGVASIGYVLQSLLGIVLLLKLDGFRQAT